MKYEAELLFQKGLSAGRSGLYEKSIIFFKKAIDIEPRYGNAYYNLGYSYYELQEYEEAFNNFDMAINYLTEYLSCAYFMRARVYEIMNDFTNAIKDYTSSLRIDDKDFETYYNRGNVYAMIGDYNNAIKDYTTSIRLGNKMTQVYINRGNAYGLKEEYSSAISDLTRAIRIDDLDAEAYYFRGMIYAMIQEYEAAMNDFVRALNIRPNYNEARDGLINAKLLSETGNRGSR